MPPEYPDWYAAWMIHHCDQFALMETTEAAPFVKWWAPLAEMSVTEAELYSATRSMMGADKAPFKVVDHYFAIKALIGEARNKAENYLQDAAERKRESQIDDGVGLCADCSNSGYVSVPHPRYCTGQEWRPARYGEQGNPIYMRAAVVCRCWVGKRIETKQKAGDGSDDPGKKKKKVPAKKCLTLEQYENECNGQWRDHLAENEKRTKRIDDSERVAYDREKLAKQFTALVPMAKPKGAKRK